ncbi:ABC transporter substrate-binding protein [Chloroflexota bacterium]
MKQKIGLVIPSCLLMIALVLSSCAPADGPTTTPGAEKPQYGGTINTVTVRFKNIDPYRYDTESRYPLSIYLDRLLVGDWAVDRNKWSYSGWVGYTPVKFMKGALLENWEMPDLLTLVLHVRKGIHYQDKPPVNGREFTADDIAWNWERMKNSPFLDQTWLKRIEKITVLDKYTVELKLSPPEQVSSMWVNLLDSVHVFFIAKETVGSSGEVEDWKNMVGTGPFMIEDFIADSSLTFQRNPNYWGYDERNPKNQLPYADGVKVLIIPDDSTRQAALLAGRIDFLPRLDWQTGDQLKKNNPKIVMRQAVAGTNHGFAMRVDVAPFDDIRVRQACSMAINREAMVQSFFGGYATPYSGMVKELHGPPYWIPYDELPDKPMWTSVSAKDVLSYNPEKAKQLLAEAGYPNGLDTVINAATDLQGAEGLPEIVQADLAKIGVRAKIEARPWGVMTAIFGSKEMDQMIEHMWSYAPDVLKYFSRTADHTIKWNYANVDDPVFTEMYKKASTNLDVEERGKQIREMNMYTIEHAFYIFMPNPQTVTAWWPWLKGYGGEGSLGGQNQGALLARLWVDQKLKAEMGK